MKFDIKPTKIRSLSELEERGVGTPVLIRDSPMLPRIAVYEGPVNGILAFLTFPEEILARELISFRDSPEKLLVDEKGVIHLSEKRKLVFYEYKNKEYNNKMKLLRGAETK